MPQLLGILIAIVLVALLVAGVLGAAAWIVATLAAAAAVPSIAAMRVLQSIAGTGPIHPEITALLYMVLHAALGGLIGYRAPNLPGPVRRLLSPVDGGAFQQGPAYALRRFRNSDAYSQWWTAQSGLGRLRRIAMWIVIVWLGLGVLGAVLGVVRDTFF